MIRMIELCSELKSSFVINKIYNMESTHLIIWKLSTKVQCFSFLYHVSVGIERLQKIVLVLSEEVSMDNHEEFEKSLITHSHAGLNRRILTSTEIELNSRKNIFLQVLTTFYKYARYDRFNFESQYSKEQQMFAKLSDYNKNKIYFNLGLLNINEPLDKPVKQLTLGTKQKIVATLCLASNKPIVICDEPTLGLDYEVKFTFLQIYVPKVEKG